MLCWVQRSREQRQRNATILKDVLFLAHLPSVYLENTEEVGRGEGRM